MSNDKGTDMQNDDAFEALLSQATPRPVPTAEETAQARDEVRREWLAVAMFVSFMALIFTGW